MEAAGGSIYREIDAEDQAFTPHFADEIELASKFFDSLAQLGAAFANVREKVRVFHDVQEFQRDGAYKRTATESGAVHSGNERGCEFFVGDDGAER